MNNLISYIHLFFMLLVDTFSFKKIIKIENFEEKINNANSTKHLNFIKLDMRDLVGTTLAFSISFIWLTMLSLILFFFNFYLALTLTLCGLTGFVFFIDKWRYLNTISNLLYRKQNELEELEK